MPNKYGEKLVALDMERFKYNLAKGTQMTRSVEKLLGMCNCLWLFQMSKVYSLWFDLTKALTIVILYIPVV
jgi:ribosomal protein S16